MELCRYFSDSHDHKVILSSVPDNFAGHGNLRCQDWKIRIKCFKHLLNTAVESAVFTKFLLLAILSWLSSRWTKIKFHVLSRGVKLEPSQTSMMKISIKNSFSKELHWVLNTPLLSFCHGLLLSQNFFFLLLNLYMFKLCYLVWDDYVSCTNKSFRLIAKLMKHWIMDQLYSSCLTPNIIFGFSFI